MKTKFKILVLLVTILNWGNIIYAQSYYMHEAAEDSDGAGLWGLLILIGIIIIAEKLFGNNKEEH